MAIDNWKTKTEIPIKLDGWIKKTTTVSDDLRDQVSESLNIYAHIAEEERLKSIFEIRDDRGKARKIAPLEFIATCLLICQWKDRLTMLQLAEAIRLMRMDVRSYEKDVRLNTRASKKVAEFIDKKLKSKVKTLTKAGKSAMASKAILKATPKRKRKEEESDSSDSEDDEEEEDESPAPKKTRKAPAKAKVKATPSKATSATKAAPAKKKKSPAEDTKASMSLPRGPAMSQSAPTVPDVAPPLADTRRRASDVVPKTEPSPTPAGVQPLFIPPQVPPTPANAANWPNPYPTPHGQTPSPNPNSWAAQGNLFTSDRLASLNAAKAAGANPQQQFFPFTPPASQSSQQAMPSAIPPGLGDFLLSRMNQGAPNAIFEGGFGRPDFAQGYGGNPPQNGAWTGQGGVPPPQQSQPQPQPQQPQNGP